MSEMRRSLTVVNERGLHVRASAKFVGAVSELPDTVEVMVAKGGNSANATSRAGGGGGLSALLDKVTGKDREKKVKVVRKSTVSAAPTVAAAAPARPAKGSGMHPSELGKMNGALNANVNALIAHLKLSLIHI